MARKPSLSDTVVVFDDKGLMIVEPDGSPVPSPGAKVVFRQFNGEPLIGHPWESVNTSSLMIVFDTVADLKAYCRENKLRFEQAPVGVDILAWTKGL